MKSGTFDAVLVGGGHNGLVAATLLARSGLRVAVLEATDAVGGAAAAWEIHPGFRVPALAHVLPTFDRRAARALRLDHGGVTAPARGLATLALVPEGGAVPVSPGSPSVDKPLRPLSPADAAALADFQRRLNGHAAALRLLFETAPPRLEFGQRRNLLALGRLAWSIRRRGRPAMRELLRIITMNVADLLDDNLENEVVKGAYALDAVLGTDHGPRSPNTVFTLLHRLAGHGQPPGATVGGTGRLMEALAAAARAAGVDIRTGARVARILVDAGETRGVELAEGAVIDANLVVSNADPATTFVDLVGADHLDADFLAEVKAIRMRGTTGKVSFALDRRPGLPAPAGEGPVRWLWAPSIEYVDRAFDHVKYGEAVPEPALEITVPSLADSTCAPDGKHVMSVNVAYAACTPDFDADALAETVTALIERHAPGFSASVLARQALGPRDIEQRFGMRGGHWHHGDIALDQFFMIRPVPGFARYRTPVTGLYLCGAGTHPGGGVTGTNGFNAAREILHDRRRGRGQA